MASDVPYSPLPDEQKAIVEEPRSSFDIQPAGSGRTWDHGIWQCGCVCCCGENREACEIAKWLGEYRMLACCFPCLGVILLRLKTRMLFGIRGSLVGDICCTCYCMPCVVWQMRHELHHLRLHKNLQTKESLDTASTWMCE